MKKSVLSAAEERFTATRKKDIQFLKDREMERQARVAKSAKLKALRLAKEEADREAAAAKAAKKATRSKTAATRKSE